MRRVTVGRLFGLVLFLLLVAACGDDGGAGDSGPPDGGADASADARPDTAPALDGGSDGSVGDARVGMDSMVDPGGADIVTLTVFEHAGVARAGRPLRWGVPLPQGRVAATTPLVLVDSGGFAMPTQSRDLALWPDGSRRWVLLDTQVQLAAGATARLTLRTLEAPHEVLDPLTVTESAEAFTIDTGPLEVEIDRTSGSVLRRAWLDSELVLDAPTGPDRGPFVATGGTEYLGARLTASSAPLGSDAIDAYRSWGDDNLERPANRFDPWDLEVVVEEQGPVHAVVRVTGTHLAADGSTTGTFVVRVHATRGARNLRFEQTFIYTGAEGEGVQSYGFRLPVAGDETWLEAESVAGGASLEHLDWQAHRVDGDERAGMAVGTARRSNGSVGQAVALRDMAERFPKALVHTSDGIEVQLYPEAAAEWSLARYSHSIDTANGETGDPPNRGAQGLARTDTWLWAPFSGGAGGAGASSIDGLGRALDAGPLALVADPQWVSDARVMGVGAFSFAVEDDAGARADAHYRADRLLKVVADFMRVNQRSEYGWFGIENYGDIRGDFDGGNASFTWRETGRYGWSGNSGEPSNQLWLQYLRRPDVQVLRDAEALATHTLDVQTVHYGDANSLGRSDWNGRNRESTVGSLHRHGRQAFSGYAGQPEYSHLAGVETWYYLSGDERARDVLYEAAEFMHRYGPETLRWTARVNGVDVLSRAAAVFHDDAALAGRYEARLRRLTEWTNDGRSPADELAGEDSLGGPFNLFVRQMPGLMYHHERSSDMDSGLAVLAVADALVAGGADPLGIRRDGESGGVFYHMATVAYAASVADEMGVDRAPYVDLASRILALNCHANDAPDTDAISPASLEAIPEDWRAWSWSWETDPLAGASPGILWIDRQITWRNGFMQDYHSYRAFAHWAPLAAVVEPGSVACE